MQWSFDEFISQDISFHVLGTSSFVNPYDVSTQLFMILGYHAKLTRFSFLNSCDNLPLHNCSNKTFVLSDKYVCYV